MPSTTTRSASRAWRTSSLRLILLVSILLSTLAAGSPSPKTVTIPTPTNVQATTGLPYMITVSWDAVSDYHLDHFDIIVYSLGGAYRIAGEVPSYGTGSYSYDIFLDDYNYFAYQDYQIAVMACPENGYWCDTVSAKVTGSGIIAPPHLTATSGTYPDRVEISFQEWIPDAYRRYEIYRSTSSSGPFTKIGQLTSYLHSTNQNLFVDSAVVPGTTYYYSGIICNDNQPFVPGGCSETSLIPAQGHASLSSPGIQASDGTSHVIELSWDPVPGAIYYEIFRQPTNTAPDPSVDPYHHQTSTATTSYTDANMTPYKDFFYWVRAYAGSPATYTALSDSDSGWRTYELAININASDGTSPDAVGLVWQNEDNALIDFYQIYRADTADGDRTVIGASTTLTFTDSSAVPIDSYYYWIKACDITLRCSGMAGPDSGWRALGDPPTITSISNQTIAEDSNTGALTFTVDDTETDPAVLQVSGTSSNTTLLPEANIVFGGSGGNRTATLTPAADQNGTSSVVITVTDPSGQTDQTSFTLTVSPANDDPTDLALSSDTVAENQPVGTVVGTFSTTDPDLLDSHTYSLVTGTGAADNSSFNIIGNELQTAEIFDWETKNSYSIRVQTDDSNGGTHQEALVITIQDVDEIAPDVNSILRVDPSPTNAASVDFTVTFSEDVTGVGSGDFTLSTSGLTGASVSSVSGSGNTYTVSVNTGSGSGTLRLDVLDDDSIQDLTGNPLGGVGLVNGDFITGQSYTLDRDIPQVTTIVRADPDPTNDPSVEFDITFNKVVSGVDSTDFSLSASGLSGVLITALNGGGNSYTAIVNTGTGSGTLRLDLVDNNTIVDGVGNPLGGPGVGDGDFSSGEYFTIDRQVPLTAGSTPADLAIISPGPTEITIAFSEDVLHDGSADGADNTANYLLFQTGANGIYDTSSCVSYPGSVGDDVFYLINTAVYENNAGAGPYQTVLGINNGVSLPVGEYRLLVCGTTSIEDLSGNTINGGSDELITFTVQRASLPETGFAPGRVTGLPTRTPGEMYSTLDDLRLEIPALGISEEIVGVPVSDLGWDLTWVDKNVGWLNGSAYPTWAGNTALTAHAYLASGLPGPFADLDQLGWGQQVIIHSAGQRYLYQVQSLDYVRPSESWPITTHEDYDWITLITCRAYDEGSGGYLWRTVVRAVLVEVMPE